MQPRTSQPGKVLALVFLLQQLPLLVIEAWQRVAPLRPFTLQIDYAFPYYGAQRWLHGLNPYFVEPDLVAPPLALLYGGAFHRLAFMPAYHAMQLVVFAVTLIALALFCRALGLTPWNAVLFFAATLTFAPFLSAIGGMNLDPLMLILVLLAYSARNRIVRWLLVAASIGVKLFTGLYVVVLAYRRRWLAVAGTLGWLAVLIAPFWKLGPAALANFRYRGSIFTLVHNISPAQVIALVLGEQREALWRPIYAVFWGGSLIWMLLHESGEPGSENASREDLLRFLPWMIAAPALSHFYEGTMLVGTIGLVIRAGQARPLLRGEKLMAAGLVVAGIFPYAYAQVLPLSAQAANWARTFPDPIASIGLTLVMIGQCWAAREAQCLRVSTGNVAGQAT